MDFFKLAINLARAQAKGIKHEDDGILSCKHHPDNGGDCRWHKLQSNGCNGAGLVVLQGKLQEGGHGRQENPDGERQAVGRYENDLRKLADATRWAREKADRKNHPRDECDDWPDDYCSMD